MPLKLNSFIVTGKRKKKEEEEKYFFLKVFFLALLPDLFEMPSPTEFQGLRTAGLGLQADVRFKRNGNSNHVYRTLYKYEQFHFFLILL